MLKIEAKGMDGMIAKLKKHKLLMEDEITDTKQRLAKLVFTDLVRGSPQWSGNLASNWYIEFHGNTGSYRPIPGYSEENWQRTEGEDLYQVGDDPAVSNTIGRELPKIPSIRWNSKVTIANYTPYAAEVEEGIGPFGPIRDVNYKYGQIAMVGYVMAKYSKLRTLKRRV